MNVIVCIDDEYGMMFNNRRQSRDGEVINRIVELTRGHRLWMNMYSVLLFNSCKADNIYTDDAFMDRAEKGDYCFAETVDISKYSDKIDSITLFRWNRLYPNDMRLIFDFTDYKMQSTHDFKGSSHDRITEEVYRR